MKNTTDDVNKIVLELVKKISKAVKVAIDATLPIWQTHIRKEHLTGGTTAIRLKKVTGRLSNSVAVAKAIINGGSLIGGIKIGTKYAGVHIGTYGHKTIIKPKKKSGYLAIPLKAAKTAAGRLKAAPKDDIWGKTFIAKNIIFQKKESTKKSKIIPLFVLKKSVEIPVRVDVYKLIEWIRPLIIKEITEAIYNVN